jgi:DDE family transposase
MTQCNKQNLLFQDLGNRKVVADFNGGTITSDAGALLLREIDLAHGLLDSFSQCFTDMRDERYIEHSVRDLIAQRAFALCLGYEDLNDHETLRSDPLFATVCGKNDPTGKHRKSARDQGHALAGKSTLNRLELQPPHLLGIDRYKKIVVNGSKIAEFFVEVFLSSFSSPPEEIILDVDATDDRLHGKQEGRFFHGYYDCYCYLPLYVFCGDHLLCAKLRRSNIDAAAGSVEEVSRIVELIRLRWPEVRVYLRADSGFCREELFNWCESHNVGYFVGMARNARLLKRIGRQQKEAKTLYEETGDPARVFKDFSYRTNSSWSKSRRIIAKAEHLEKGANPRFVVCHDPWNRYASAPEIYENLYCARGEMENKIKEQQLYLFADRTSAGIMRANQLRLWYSSLAYVIMNTLRNETLKDTELEHATCQTIRLKLLKIGALVRVSVRRVSISISSAYPYQHIFRDAYRSINRAFLY